MEGEGPHHENLRHLWMNQGFPGRWHMLNVHHLELFYHVARHEGIVTACRHIPYGVQQPAVSAQVARLEADLGVRLFERRPFQLTPAGRALYDFIAPFFGRLGEVEDMVRGKLAREFRLAGLTEVMRDHLPALLGEMRNRFPDIRITLQEIDQRGAERLIARGETDVAITVVASRLPPGFQSKILARFPLCLIATADAPFRTAAGLLKAGAAGEVGLVGLPSHEMLPRMFQQELGRRGLVWRTAMETSSQDLVTIYVRNGLGVGLTVRTPRLEEDSTLRVFPLTGFPTLPIGVFWRGRPGAMTQAFIELLTARTQLVLQGG